MNDFFSPNSFSGSSDSARIQAAINAAHNTGINKVIIPRVNQRNESLRWDIDQTIYLPSHMTVVIDNAHLRMVDGVICRMFCNSEVDSEFGKTQAGEQTDIHIVGIGDALLDGGLPNGLDEFTSMKNGFPSVRMNLTIHFHNVRRFSVKNLHIRDQRWWAMMFMFARDGVISDINLELARHKEDSYAGWRNQDGIDLRVGCSNILIQNISGETGDDTIALTALLASEAQLVVEGRDTDIHDVMIQNVRAVSNMCAIVRLLHQYGNKIYNISMRDIFDMSRPGESNRTQMVLRLGENGYHQNKPENMAKHGDMYNISVDNVHSRAMTAILTTCTMKNFHASNIYVHTDGQYAWTCGGHHLHVHGDHCFIYLPEREDEAQTRMVYPNGPDDGVTAENILIENIYHTAHNKRQPDALCSFNAAQVKNAVVRNVCCDEELPLYVVHNPVPGMKVRFEDVMIAGQEQENTVIDQ